MDKKTSYTETFGALMPPATPNEGVGWLTRFILKNFQGAKNSWKARPNSLQEAPLIAMAEKLCPKMGIKTPPQIFIYESPVTNAVSLINGTVAISSKLLSSKTPDQVETVMGHELAHHRHKLRDLAIVWGGLGVGFFAYSKTLGAHIDKKIKNFNLVGRIASNIAKLCAETVTLFGLMNLYQQKNEYEADRESGDATGQPKILAEALNELNEESMKLQLRQPVANRGNMSDTKRVVYDTLSRLEPGYIRRVRQNPLQIMNVLGTHPPTQSRVEALLSQDARMHGNEETLPVINGGR